MNERGHNVRLLADVLSEGVSADFPQGLLNEMLRLARRRRRLRQVRNTASVLAVLAGLGLLVWHQIPSRPGTSTSQAKAYALVHTQPLPPEARIQTKLFPASSTVASVRTDKVIITSQASSPVREINDEELLALVPEPAALVRYGPHSAELVFVKASDLDGTMRN